VRICRSDLSRDPDKATLTYDFPDQDYGSGNVAFFQELENCKDSIHQQIGHMIDSAVLDKLPVEDISETIQNYSFVGVVERADKAFKEAGAPKGAPATLFFSEDLELRAMRFLYYADETWMKWSSFCLPSGGRPGQMILFPRDSIKIKFHFGDQGSSGVTPPIPVGIGQFVSIETPATLWKPSEQTGLRYEVDLSISIDLVPECKRIFLPTREFTSSEIQERGLIEKLKQETSEFDWVLNQDAKAPETTKA
jgi:hypothetical protein